MNARKPLKAKRGAPGKKMSNLKAIMPMADRDHLFNVFDHSSLFWCMSEKQQVMNVAYFGL